MRTAGAAGLDGKHLFARVRWRCAGNAMGQVIIVRGLKDVFAIGRFR